MRLPSYYYDHSFDDYKNILINNGYRETYKKDETLVGINDFMDRSYFIEKGILRFYIINKDGKEKTIMFIGPGGVFPLYSPIQRQYKNEHESFLCSAMSDVVVHRIAQTSMHSLMNTNGKLAITMLDQYADLAAILLYESITLSTNSTFTKICNYLYQYETILKPHGILLTQEEIAINIGVTQLLLARTLKKLRDENLITTSRKNIKIVDLKSFQLYCDGTIQ